MMNSRPYLMGKVVTARHRINQRRKCVYFRDIVEQCRIASDQIDFALADHPFTRVPRGILEKMGTPMIDGLMDAGYQGVSTVPHTKRTIGISRFRPMGERIANRLVKGRL